MDIIQSVYALQIIYQIVNLSPWFIKYDLWTFQRSRFLEFYSLLVIVAATGYLMYDLFSDDDFIKTNDNEIGQTVDFIQMVGIRLSHIASITEALIRRNEQKQFYEHLKEIDRIFECSLNVDMENDKFKSSTLKRGALMLLIYLASELFILITKMFNRNAHHFVPFWIFYLMPMLVCGLRYFQMFTTLRIVKLRFSKLITSLEEINLNAVSAENSDQLPPYSKFGLLDVYDLKSGKKQRQTAMENPELKKLLIIRDLYNRLYILTDLVNRQFGVSMLINIANEFISITSNCYWIFINFAESEAFMLIAASAVWSIPHLVNVLVLALMCDQMVQSTTTVALRLHRLNMDILNDNHNAVIEQFSLQLLHQKIAITAAGFFTIDCSLLYGIVGSTTTYLIILIQFHLNENKTVQ